MYNQLSLIETLRLPGSVMRIYRALRKQQGFLNTHIKPITDAAIAINDGQLDSSDIHKIFKYYGLAVPAILGEAFASLHALPMNHSVRLAATAQGGMTGLFDDFFDKAYLSDEAIAALMNNQADDSKSPSNSILFNRFYKIALEHAANPTALRLALAQVYDAQIASKKQEHGSLTQQELTELTYLKGGTSLLFYRTAFFPEPTEAEKYSLYKLGGLMQLCNDIFDVYKDREAGIQTLITSAKHIAPIQELLATSIRTAYNDFYLLGLPENQVRRFLSILSLGIFSRSFTCLKQLAGLEPFTGNTFNVGAYSRSQLICDMEKPGNILRAAGYHIHIMA